MSEDLDRRLSRLDEIEAPDLTQRIGAEPERGLPPLPSPRSRVLIGAVAFVVAVAGFAFLVAGRSRGPQTLGGPPPGTISVRRVVGNLECTASVAPVLRPGQEVGVALTLRNVGDRTMTLSNNNTGDRLTVSTLKGEVYDSQRDSEIFSLGGGFRMPTHLAPGGVVHEAAGGAPVIWTGPLTLAPTCRGNRMPVLQVNVAVPGPTPSAADAVSGAVRAADGLFDTCRPAPRGGPRIGTIHTPDGLDSAPPMRAVCAASVDRQSGFAVVRLRFITPANAKGVRVMGSYDRLTIPRRTQPAEVSVFDVVVDATGARLIGGAEEDRTLPPNHQDPIWGLSAEGWSSAGVGFCGGDQSTGQTAVFITVCPGH